MWSTYFDLNVSRVKHFINKNLNIIITKYRIIKKSDVDFHDKRNKNNVAKIAVHFSYSFIETYPEKKTKTNEGYILN